jgi:hypothetical protein
VQSVCCCATITLPINIIACLAACLPAGQRSAAAEGLRQLLGLEPGQPHRPLHPAHRRPDRCKRPEAHGARAHAEER